MPLSEHEQRLLEQIERALVAEDPKFASAVRATDPRTRARRRLFMACGLFLVGVGLLLFGATRYTVHRIPVIGIAGVVVILGSAVLAWTSYRRLAGRDRLRLVGGPGAPRPAQSGGTRASRRDRKNRMRTGGRKRSVFDRMEDRWRRRDDQRGR